VTQYASQAKDFPDLLAAKAKNLPDAIIEKDSYVVRALRALCEAMPGFSADLRQSLPAVDLGDFSCL
jgi:hypothetical protein